MRHSKNKHESLYGCTRAWEHSAGAVSNRSQQEEQPGLSKIWKQTALALNASWPSSPAHCWMTQLPRNGDKSRNGVIVFCATLWWGDQQLLSHILYSVFSPSCLLQRFPLIQRRRQSRVSFKKPIFFKSTNQVVEICFTWNLHFRNRSLLNYQLGAKKGNLFVCCCFQKPGLKENPKKDINGST